jgi:hypothetical protein
LNTAKAEKIKQIFTSAHLSANHPYECNPTPHKLTPT